MIAILRLTGCWGLLLALALPAAPALGQDTARGKELYELCAQCHGVNGAGDPVALAPAIAGFPAWFVTAQLQKFRSGGRGTHFDDISGMRMRPMSMWLQGDEDVANVAAYVASLPKVSPPPTLKGGDAAVGKEKYTLCASCHGVNGEGNQALNGSPLAGTSDWYQLTSLRKFKDGVRGGPKDPTGALMRGMAISQIPDEQTMLDLIAYISTLGAQN